MNDHSPPSDPAQQRARHWEDVYARKPDHELSWFERSPERSLALIASIEPAPARVIDIGGGQSALASLLSDAPPPPTRTVTVLDIAPSALARGQARAGARAHGIEWITGDVLTLPDLPTVDLWHDRAVFHFLTDPAEQARYVQRAAHSVERGGHAIIATFAPSGPESCSGLPVARSDANALAARFAPHFALVASCAESHSTPWGRVQDFTYVLLRRH